MPCNSTVTTVSVTVSAGGAGLAFLFGQQRRYEFSVEARYGFGYGDILRNGTKYKGNPDRSPLDNINVFAAFYYRLGKEGIRSAPSAAAQQRMEQEAARHTLRRLNKMLDKGKIPADTLLLLTLPRDSAGNIPYRFHDDRSGTPLPDCTVRTGHITGQTTVRHTPNAPTDRLKQKKITTRKHGSDQRNRSGDRKRASQ